MTKIRDVMSRDLVSFTPEMGLVEAIETLAERHISGAPVLRGGRVVGVLSATDVMEFMATNPVALADYGDAPTDREVNPLEGCSVSEAMSGGPVSTLPPTANVQEAADLMRSANIHRIFVVENDRLVGVVSSLDITRALAERRIVNRTFVFPGPSGID